MTGESLEIRFLTANDASAYWAIRLEALECEPEAFGSSPEEHRLLSVNDVAGRLSSDTGEDFTVGAFDGDRLLGTAGFLRDKQIKQRHKGHIWGVYVAREARRRNAGRDMLRAILTRAAGIDGVEQILLSVNTAQEAPVKLYRSLGFQSYGCERRALKIGERYVDEENMVLFLSTPGG
jgi:ribosomal protein S18 acetylase RimI-like enzyme